MNVPADVIGRSPGVHVTEAACEALSMMLARKPNTQRCLRLSTNQGNYRFTIDEPIEQDVIYRFEDRSSSPRPPRTSLPTAPHSEP